MNNNPYQALYDPLPDVETYLNRISYADIPQVNLETLNRLIRCHVENIPFENIDVYRTKQAPSLETSVMWDKMIVNKRGGYCFELNGLFVKLLTALGYEAYCIAVRIQMGAPYLRPVLHRAIIVCLENEKYLVDVGFGGPGPQSAVCLTSNEWQKSGSRYFRAEWDDNLVYLHMKEGEEEMVLFQFLDDPADEVDFLGPNMMCSMVPSALLYRQLVISRKLPEGHCSMDENSLTLEKNGKREVLELSDEEAWEKAAEEYMGICL